VPIGRAQPSFMAVSISSAVASNSRRYRSCRSENSCRSDRRPAIRSATVRFPCSAVSDAASTFRLPAQSASSRNSSSPSLRRLSHSAAMRDRRAGRRRVPARVKTRLRAGRLG
jgi:hypothetical protein